jgi:toxin ParE1/3/4
LKSYRLLPRAETSLGEIFDWTIEAFGKDQAAAYVEDLIARCEALAQGTAVHSSCRDVFAPDLRGDLRFTRLGKHYILFQDTPREVIVVDIIHQRRDVTGVIAAIDTRGDG